LLEFLPTTAFKGKVEMVVVEDVEMVEMDQPLFTLVLQSQSITKEESLAAEEEEEEEITELALLLEPTIMVA
jgi:hypothetical protein